ncbi:hypothetical protein ALC56_08311 [Trachymyrmex septentrionalis]|uniref:Uncharacterized protein n=1 Tax=Trachymyrmex septentrionalis TaxID=34720 RepID=A0A195FB42_9HYME|nr:hypothetical protein ALC56_08311 [Trachymyrmex septentrionalis]
MRVSRGLTSVTDERQRGSRSDTPFKDDERRDGACGHDSRVSLTGGTKCLFGRSGHRFDKHGRARGRISDGGTPDIFTSCQAGVATRCVASRRVG